MSVCEWHSAKILTVPHALTYAIFVDPFNVSTLVTFDLLLSEALEPWLYWPILYTLHQSAVHYGHI